MAKTPGIVGDPYAEKNHGRFFMIPREPILSECVLDTWAAISPRPAIYIHLGWRKAMANEWGFPSEVGSADVL